MSEIKYEPRAPTYAPSSTPVPSDNDEPWIINTSEVKTFRSFGTQYERQPSKKKRSKQPYQETSEQKKKRAARNAARNKMIKAGKARKGDGKDVDHKDGNPKNNNKENLRMQTKKANRSFKRNSKAGKK